MIDVNNSQDYDSDTFGEVLAEQREKQRARQLAGALTALGGNQVTGVGALGNPLAEVTDAMEVAKGEVTDPVAFMQKHYSGRRLWRFILTHPDLDHMRGIKRLYETIGFNNFWDTAHNKPTPKFKNDADKDDWDFYQKLRSGGMGLRPKNYLRGTELFAFGRNEDGSVGGDNIRILSPTRALIDSYNKAGKSNDLSYVLRVWHHGKSVLLPGDIESEGWDDLQRTYGVGLKSDFMRASHHGRDSGYHLPTLKLIQPKTVVVSVGRKPVTDASSKYAGQCEKVYSTRYYGNLTLHIHDDGSYQWFGERNVSWLGARGFKAQIAPRALLRDIASLSGKLLCRFRRRRLESFAAQQKLPGVNPRGCENTPTSDKRDEVYGV
jgi:competence protein ComEC